MNQGIVIIGSGFAARPLVKSLRKQDAKVPITLIASDSIDEYNKPDLSHVISQKQHADSLTRQTADEFAQQYNLRIFPFTKVTDIDSENHRVIADDKWWVFDKLVLATGASAFVPPVPGQELMLTLNSQAEYRACESQLKDAQHVTVIGGGLIGTELAMDFCRAGKNVTLIDNAATILTSLMPPVVSSRLQHHLTEMGVHLLLKSQLISLEQTPQGITVRLDRDRCINSDIVIAAAGLRPQNTLAHHAGIKVNKGIVVNSYLQTSHPDIYALGDCAEINGQVLSFLQPIQLSAICLAKNLLGHKTPLVLPPMLVNVKTPTMPLQLAGETQRTDLNWHIVAKSTGMVAKGLDEQGQLRAFVASEEETKDAFTLLRTLTV